MKSQLSLEVADTTPFFSLAAQAKFFKIYKFSFFQNINEVKCFSEQNHVLHH